MTKKTLHEMADESGVSLRTLKKLAKLDFLKMEPGKREPNAQIRYYLRKGKTLTVGNFLDVLRNPSLLESVGDYSAAGHKQIKALGDVIGQALPASNAAALIYGASISDADSLGKLAQWAQSVIPAKGCGYHYLAVRMLFNVPETRFKESYSQIARAIVNLRKYPPMASYVAEKDENGMRFCRPQENFDL